MADPLSSPEERDLLAAEFALGVLEDSDRVQALRLQLSDRSFRTAVIAWQGRLAPLFDEVPEVAPDPATWPKIAAALGERGSTGMAYRLRAWRFGAVAAGAVAAALALVLALQPMRGPAPQPPAQSGAIAQLQGKAGEPLVVAQYDPASGRLRVRASGLPESARVPELWVIPAGGAPRSLGQIARAGRSELTLDATTRALLRSGSTIAITLEPADGKLHAAPTGAILSTAPLSSL